MTVVMKFGGTSVGDADAIARAVEIIESVRERSRAVPVVVVSAMAGVTDRLLALTAAAEGGDGATAAAGVEELRRRHLETVERLLRDGATRLALEAALGAQLDELDAVLRAISILREAPPRSRDSVAATGELLNSRIVAAALEAAGVPAVWVDARRVIVTDAEHTAAAPVMHDTRLALAREVQPILADARVPVIAGYVGATLRGVTTTLGRGGSDYTAAVIGAALGAREIQIWTDVDGMLTADPRVIDAPGLVSHLSFAEASELAYFGAKVLHPSTILPAVDRNIPIRILNSRRPQQPGTLITAERPPTSAPLAAVACKRGVTVIDVTSTRMLMAHGFLSRLFEAFDRHRTPVDVVATSEVDVSVTIDDDRRLEAIVTTLRGFAEVSVERDMAILCAVGDNLRSDPRLAARVLGALEDFPLRMVSQAASRRNLTVVLREADVAAAMARLHDEFFARSPA